MDGKEMHPILQVEGLGKSFGKVEVLRDISFTLDKGRVLSVIGSSGSGKTTLLRCITSLEKANKGKIIIGGETVFDAENPVKDSARERRRKQLKTGLVFQSFNLFPQYTALQNVTLAARLAAKESEAYKKDRKAAIEEIRARGMQILSDVGLSDKADFYPWQLSGGQQQRVSIARALCMKPEILFFDEPTSALDPELTGEILRVIKQLASTHMTMVIVTHEMTFAKDVSDEIIFMNKGVIEEQGDPQIVFENPKSARLREFLNKFTD